MVLVIIAIEESLHQNELITTHKTAICYNTDYGSSFAY